ncbi:MAG TPA: M20/M25/M40 family metallo-hydrolase [Steroidobacteraceae bacterium]|nr:M20/M25/M40 family metallo-hydrolase [Steroidobacteraceae bacterium]
MKNQTRRAFLGGALATGATLALARQAHAAPSRKPVYDQIQRHRDQTVAMLQQWIRQPSIAAENRGVNEGCELTMLMLRDAGFQRAERVPTDGQPGIFATLDAGARRTVGVYFMYDVKQANPEEWMSPPWEARLLDLPDLGTVIMGRGAVNQKGPETMFLAALHAIRNAGGKVPVNLVLVAEGEEEIGSPHFRQIVHTPAVREALAKCEGVFMPEAGQGTDGTVTVSLGAKGVVEVELVSSGEKWGRGPSKDVHSSNRARLDSPSWHLVQALNTMIGPNGDPAIDNYVDNARPLSAAEEKMLDVAATRMNEAKTKAGLGATHWARDADWRQALEDMCARPTINIEGLVGGYTGPGGMTILPHKAAAKLDLRLVPDMTFDDAVAKIKAHLAKRGFGDIEVNASGGYDPTTTAADARLIQAQVKVYRDSGIDPILWPRRGGSWPGYVFTGAPISLPAGHFGLGHGLRAHAPDEYFLIDSKNPLLQGLDGAVRSYVDYLYALA